MTLSFIVRWYLGTKRVKARIPKRSKKRKKERTTRIFRQGSLQEERGDGGTLLQLDKELGEDLSQIRKACSNIPRSSQNSMFPYNMECFEIGS
jgi:hypothetical protein